MSFFGLFYLKCLYIIWLFNYFFFEFIFNLVVFIFDENLIFINIINVFRICIWNLFNCNYS